MTAEITSPSLGQSESSEAGSSEPNWDDLSEPITVPPIEGVALPKDTLPNAPVCPVCDEIIVRDPSWKRMRKYHPDCAPKAGAGSQSGSSTGKGSKAAREADEVVAMYRSTMIKVALGVSVVDKYDSFVIMANLDSMCASLHGVLLRYTKFREECLAIKGGGSVFGFAMSVLFMAAPIAAHHGLIPGKMVPKLLIDMPFALFQLTQKLKEGEESLTRIMEEQLSEMKRHNEAQAAQKNAAQNGANSKSGPYVPGTATVGPS